MNEKVMGNVGEKYEDVYDITSCKCRSCGGKLILDEGTSFNMLFCPVCDEEEALYSGDKCPICNGPLLFEDDSHKFMTCCNCDYYLDIIQQRIEDAKREGFEDILFGSNIECFDCGNNTSMMQDWDTERYYCPECDAYYDWEEYESPYEEVYGDEDDADNEDEDVSEKLSVWDAADIYVHSGCDSDKMFSYTHEELMDAFDKN